MVIFLCICASGKKSPFYVAYTQIGNLRIENLRMRRKNFANRLTRICVIVTEPKKTQSKTTLLPETR